MIYPYLVLENHYRCNILKINDLCMIENIMCILKLLFHKNNHKLLFFMYIIHI